MAAAAGRAVRPNLPRSGRSPQSRRARRAGGRLRDPRPPVGSVPARTRARAGRRWRSGSTPKATWDDLVLPDEDTDLLHADRRAGRAARATVYDDWGFARNDEPRPRHQRAVRRRERHGQDDGRRGHRQRSAPRPLPHRPLGGGQQVHRRDREEPAPAVRRGRGRRRDPVLRRGRRAVRQSAAR